MKIEEYNELQVNLTKICKESMTHVQKVNEFVSGDKCLYQRDINQLSCELPILFLQVLIQHINEKEAKDVLKNTSTELDLCKSILKRLFHGETSFVDGHIDYTRGGGYSSCNYSNLQKDVKRVIGDYE